MVLQQLHVQISLCRPRGAGDVPEPGRGKIEGGLAIRECPDDNWSKGGPSRHEIGVGGYEFGRLMFGLAETSLGYETSQLLCFLRMITIIDSCDLEGTTAISGRQFIDL
jgi:hypothetical protein